MIGLTLAVAAIPHWLLQLRSASLILVGVADNSVIPMPGSMDVLTIWLAASNPALWSYYAFMATIGALFGGYITYILACKGGKPAIEKRLRPKRAARVFKRFERWGFWAVAIPAILPPPFPIVPFLLAAGAMQYPVRKFLGALALGRAIRFIILTRLGVAYGTWIVSFFAQYYKPALAVLIGLSSISGLFAYVQYRRYSHA